MFRVNILTTKLYSLEVTPQLWIFWNIPFSMFQTSHVPLQPFCADLTPMTPTCYDFNSLSKWQPIPTENNKPSLHSSTSSVFTESSTSLSTSCWNASVRKIMEQFSITWFSTAAYMLSYIWLAAVKKEHVNHLLLTLLWLSDLISNLH